MQIIQNTLRNIDSAWCSSSSLPFLHFLRCVTANTLTYCSYSRSPQGHFTQDPSTLLLNTPPSPAHQFSTSSPHPRKLTVRPLASLLPPNMSAAVDARPQPASHLSSEQVPLDTIPISPAAPNGMDRNGNADPDVKENQDPNGASSGGANADKDEQITIFHDKDNFNVKHPLIHEWTLWFTKPPSGKVSNPTGVPEAAW